MCIGETPMATFSLGVNPTPIEELRMHLNILVKIGLALAAAFRRWTMEIDEKKKQKQPN